MNTLRKCMSLILCPCVSAYSFPVSASTTYRPSDLVRVQLTDSEMAGAVGGNGNVDVEMADYKVGGATATAVITNRFTMQCNYELNLIDQDGTVIQTLASGVIDPGVSMLVTGTPSRDELNGRRVQARVYQAGLPGFEAVDSSWAGRMQDTDGDGLSDAVELHHGLDPDDPSDAAQDFDGDGLTNAEEIEYGTNLNVADTDGDGIIDGAELTYGLNPLNAADAALDPDQDFLTNIEEINEYHTDPYVVNLGLLPDSDGDGLNDRLELALGLDPADAQSKIAGGDTPEMQKILHVINRATFGPTNELIAEIQQMGLNDWLAGQLAPIGLDNDPPDPAQTMRDSNKVAFNTVERAGAIRPVHSIKQLQAKMGLFWDNHFSTSISKTSSESELYEEDQFFVNAFGNFRELLGVSAKSDAMQRYLDQRTSTKAGPNENYAREVMELHTLGATTASGYYTSDDVASLAKIFSGWSTNNTQGVNSRYVIDRNDGGLQKPLFLFVFNSGNHDTSPKTFLNTPLTGLSGQAEGETALDMLASHASTADFICTKLTHYLVSDTPQTTTVNGCVNTFVANASAPNQIGLVVQNLLESAEFNDASTYRTKFKDNQEYLFGLARFLHWSAVAYTTSGNSISVNGVGGRVALTGQPQFGHSEPTGWPELGDDWIDSDVALNRFREANRMIYDGQQTHLVQYFTGLGLTSSADIIGHVMEVLLGGVYEPRHVELAYWALNPNGSAFSINASDAETRLKNLVARIAQLPEYSLQ